MNFVICMILANFPALVGVIASSEMGLIKNDWYFLAVFAGSWLFGFSALALMSYLQFYHYI